MSEFHNLDRRRLLQAFIATFIAAALFGTIIYFAGGFFSDEQHPTLLIVSACFLWAILAAFAFTSLSILELLAFAFGLTWGFLVSISFAISVQNGHDSVHWPVMVPTLGLMPFVAIGPVIPIWYVRKLRRRSNETSSAS